MAADKHIAELTNSKYHKDGGCVVRHASARNAECKYEENGYNVTSTARMTFYNAPIRFNAEEVFGLPTYKLKRKKGGKKYTLTTPVQQDPDDEVDPNIWNIGSNGNFVPAGMGGQGYHHPYLHNWHHMIANEMLFKLLVDKKYGLRLLKVLMIGRYNLNGPRNIVLLPQKEEVGSIIRWPIHPNNHPGFDEYAEQKITDLKMRLMKVLGNKKLHELKPDNVANVAEDVNKVSDLLFQILEQMPGGVHINKIKEYGAAIEKRLAKKRK